MSEQPVFTTEYGDAQFTFENRPDPFKELPRLAERLGVAPLTDAERKANVGVIFIGDGRAYDFYALMTAFLDKIDKACGER